MSTSPVAPAAAWDAALAEGRIPCARCRNCGRNEAYARSTCTRCLSEDLEPGASSGAGEIYTLTRVGRAAPGLAVSADRYAVALIKLDDVDGHVMAAVDASLSPGDRVQTRVDLETTPPRLVAEPA